MAAWRASAPELARVVDAWDSLPPHIRASILALVDAAAVGPAARSREEASAP
jgi:hypothetical protein